MTQHKNDRLTIPRTIEEIINWKVIDYNDRPNRNYPKDSETMFKIQRRDLGWGEFTDVMYSFHSLYALGIMAYNPEAVDYRKGKNLDKTDKVCLFYTKQPKQLVWSANDIQKKYINHDGLVTNLNQNSELKKFAKHYFSLGNIIPIWPEGNKAKGNQESVFLDIPELYFNSCNEFLDRKKTVSWFTILKDTFDNIFLDELLSDELFTCDKTYKANKDIINIYKFEYLCKSFKEGRVDLYTKYLKHANSIIRHRNEELEKWLEKNKKNKIRENFRVDYRNFY